MFGVVYRSRINDITTLSDSTREKPGITIKNLDTQFKDVAELDRIQSRTFDADLRDPYEYFGYTDFSNTINTMDENHWLQVDSDTYGNNILGDELDFRPERAGRETPPIYTVGITRLLASTSTVAGIIEYQYNLNGNAQATLATSEGIAEREQLVTLLSITATSSSVSAVANRVSDAEGTLLSSPASSNGIAERIITPSQYWNPPVILSGNATIAEPPCLTEIIRNYNASGNLTTGNATIVSNDPHWYVLVEPVHGVNGDNPPFPFAYLQYVWTDPYYPGFYNDFWKNPDTYYMDKVPPLGSGDWKASGNLECTEVSVTQDVPVRQTFLDPSPAPDTDPNQMWLLAEDPIVRNYANYFNTQCFSFDGRYICTESFNDPNSKSGRRIMVIDLETNENIFVDMGSDPRWAKTTNTLYYTHRTDNGELTYKTDYPSGIEVRKYDVATKVISLICYGVENLGELNGDDTVLYGVKRYRDWKDANVWPNSSTAPNGGRKPYPNDGVEPPIRTNPPSAPPAESEYGFGGEFESVTMSTVGVPVPPSLPPADGWSPQLPVRFGDGSGKRPLPNPNHPPVMSRNKIIWNLNGIRGDTIFGRSRTWTDPDSFEQTIACTLLDGGHPTWTGDGEYVILGNQQLAGRKWDEPYPSNIELLANHRTSDPGAVDTNGRWVTTNGRIIDIRSGGSRAIARPRSRIIYPTKNSTGANQGDQSEAWDADQKGSPDGTKMCFVSNFKANATSGSNIAITTALVYRDSTNSINVVSHDGWPDSGYFSYRSEVIFYGSKTAEPPGSGSNHKFQEIQRNVFGTTGVGIDTGSEIHELEGRIIPEEYRAPDAKNAPNDLQQYYTTGITPNHIAPSYSIAQGVWVNKFPNGTNNTINSGILRFQRQTDVYVTVARLPDAPVLRGDISAGFGPFLEMIPGENHREIRGYKLYKNSMPYPSLPEITSIEHWSPPKDGLPDNGQTIFLPGTTVTIPPNNAGTFTIAAVEYSGLESKPSNAVSIDDSLEWTINILDAKPADYEWTTVSWQANGLASTEAIATSIETPDGSKIVTHKGEEPNYGTLCLIQTVKYAYGNIVHIFDYDYEGTITRKQYYNTDEPGGVNNYRTKQEYWDKALNTTPDPDTGNTRNPERVSIEFFNESGIKTYAEKNKKELNTYKDGVGPVYKFSEAWWYDDGLDIEPSLRGPLDGNGQPEGEYWRYLDRDNSYKVYPACTPIRRLVSDKYYRRVPAGQFLTDGITPNPLYGSHLWVSTGNQLGIYADDPGDDPGNDPTPVDNINYLDNILGNDASGDGTQQNPWKTLAKALNVGIKPGWTTIGIDNGPKHPYRLNESSDANRIYFSDKYGISDAPITLKGDPNSSAYQRRDIDRPLTNSSQQYPNMYISQANVVSGWENSTEYAGVWETDNPQVRDASVSKSVLFGCPETIWNTDGILGVVRAINVTWSNSNNTAANLEEGQFYMTNVAPRKVYYKPKPGEDILTHHFEIVDAADVFSMKRIKHMTFEGLTIVCSGGSAFSTDGTGINRQIGAELQDDWCNDITLKNCYMRYTRLGTSFNIGENYLIDNCVTTDAMNGGFGFYGSKGDYPNSDRGFPVRNTLIQNCKVTRCRANDGIVWHSNSPYADTRFLGRIRWDDVGGNHEVINSVSSNNGENGFDITSGYDITLRGCTTHDNRHSGTTVAHYARNVKIYDQVSINDDTRRNFGGPLSIGDARDLLVDNMKAYNPGYRFINITGDAQGIEIRNSTFTAGPDTEKSDLITVSRATAGEFNITPRNNSTPVTRTPTSSDVGTGIATTAPQQAKDINIHDNTFNIPYGGINNTSPNSRFKFFLNMAVLPGLGFNVKLENNVWNTSVLNTPWKPLEAQAPDGSNYGPYTCKNTLEAQGDASAGYPIPANSSLYQPVVAVSGYQSYFAAGIFPAPASPSNGVAWPNILWNWWPNGVSPEGRETTKFGLNYLADRNDGANYRVPFNPPLYNESIGLTLSDTISDLPLYVSAHLLQVQGVSYWDAVTVEGAIDQNGVAVDGTPYWERTNWTIASPSSSGTSRASAYKNIASRNVSAETRWAGDYKTSAGPMVCVDTSRSDFGLSLVWYAGASGTDSFLALVEVGQSTQWNIVGISAPYPHTEGTELRLRIVVENGLIRCYAGTGKVYPSTITIDNSNILPLIPLTTTEGGAVFSDTYSVENNNPNLNTSTTHGVYLINNETAGSRTNSLKYARYPDSLIPLPDAP